MIRVKVPVKIVSVANLREPWQAKHRRSKEHREAARWAFVGIKPPLLPLVITITRVGGRKLDDDNLISGCKALRDGIADWLFIDDGSDKLTWRYEQRKEPNAAYAEITVKGIK